MAKRALIIYRVNEAEVSNRGVIKKLDGQAKGFRLNGWEADTIRISGKDILLNKHPIKKLSKSKFGSVLFEFFQSISSVIDFTEYDLLYIRYGLSFAGFISFLKKAKAQNPNIKILLEFATFPYADEWTGTKGLVVRKVDSHFRKRLRKYIDHVVHLGKEKSILGMECINSENGIDVDGIKLRKKKNLEGPIKILAVGKWQFWHGLDRLLRGMAEFDREDKFELIVVGKGPAILDLKQLSQELELQSEVSFVGEKVGKDLDEYFDHVEIGVGTLGMHRKKIEVDSSLKHREYASRGLPFFLCTPDNDFPKTTDFIKYFPQSEESIDIKKLIEFVKRTEKIEPNEIRKFAIKNLSWESKISRILEAIVI